MTTTSRENAALVRGFLVDVVAGGDTDAVPIFLAEDMDEHNLVFGANRGQGDVTTLGWQVLAAADIDIEIADVVATDEAVAVRASVTGTHRESLMNLAPTGASFDIPYAWFCRIEDRGIAEIWSLPDGLGLMQQVGAIPERSRDRQATPPTD